MSMQFSKLFLRKKKITEFKHYNCELFVNNLYFGAIALQVKLTVFLFRCTISTDSDGAIINHNI